MTFAERLDGWNRWYDGLPQEWRFQVVLWPIIALGACNMLLSLSIRFPFGLLVLLGVLFVAAVRAPFSLGWITPAHALPSGEPGAPRLAVGGAGADWLVGLNQQYEAVPERRRFWIFPAILLVAGAINMELTIGQGWPFGLLFLFVLLALVVVRAPYVHGLLRPPSAAGAPARALQYDRRIADGHAPAPAEAHGGEPAASDPEDAAKPSVDLGPAWEPTRHDGAAMPSPLAPQRPELAPEPGETDAAANPPAPGHAPGHGRAGQGPVSPDGA